MERQLHHFTCKRLSLARLCPGCKAVNAASGFNCGNHADFILLSLGPVPTRRDCSTFEGTIDAMCPPGRAARFKAEREAQGLTLAQVAERMGIDALALSRLETGKMLNPTLATLRKGAEALGRKLEVDLSPSPAARNAGRVATTRRREVRRPAEKNYPSVFKGME
jgi:transcriptional regulator with XRE-family HTH domain